MGRWGMDLLSGWLGGEADNYSRFFEQVFGHIELGEQP